MKNTKYLMEFVKPPQSLKYYAKICENITTHLCSMYQSSNLIYVIPIRS